MKQAYLSTRQRCPHPFHHLWNNHGSWWFHGTFHLPDGTRVRHRASLKTRCEQEARRKRDHLIQHLSLPGSNLDQPLP
jgi:hypothetical protein